MQSRRMTLGLAAAGMTVAVVLFVVLRDDDGSDSGSTPTAGRTNTPTVRPKKTTPIVPATKIAFRNGAPVGGVLELEVPKGDPVHIEVTPDVPAEVHVHGYDLTEEVKAGQTAKFDFKATIEGVFEMEAHRLIDGEEQSGVQVAELTVTP
jgi:hypothetical protein